MEYCAERREIWKKRELVLARPAEDRSLAAISICTARAHHNTVGRLVSVDRRAAASEQAACSSSTERRQSIGCALMRDAEPD